MNQIAVIRFLGRQKLFHLLLRHGFMANEPASSTLPRTGAVQDLGNGTDPGEQASLADDTPGPEKVLSWIETNPTLALVGAFAIGVFLGALLRRP